tara:strand:- start:308 stop:550 length:243 start_codon:yes stop_codon:yes gene_type:complete
MTNKISNESLLLHNNCTKMLRRPSRQLLIIDVLTKMNILNKEPEEISQDFIYTEKNNTKNNTKNDLFFEKFLQVICCKID